MENDYVKRSAVKTKKSEFRYISLGQQFIRGYLPSAMHHAGLGGAEILWA
jgi:hypothetical protein